MDCLYFTDGLIKDRHTLTNLCLLFDRVHTFYLLPNYYLAPFEKRWEVEKNKPRFKKSPIEIKNITKTHLDQISLFLGANSELIENNVLDAILVDQTPEDWEGIEKTGASRTTARVLDELKPGPRRFHNYWYDFYLSRIKGGVPRPQEAGAATASTGLKPWRGSRFRTARPPAAVQRGRARADQSQIGDPRKLAAHGQLA